MEREPNRNQKREPLESFPVLFFLDFGVRSWESLKIDKDFSVATELTKSLERQRTPKYNQGSSLLRISQGYTKKERKDTGGTESCTRTAELLVRKRKRNRTFLMIWCKARTARTILCSNCKRTEANRGLPTKSGFVQRLLGFPAPFKSAFKI